ncbi:RNA-directed DNA polymerase from mobile element jockey [Plakobranchus ocellatus]|uniref:RNA-directed DNA polymerase from mobile element jockey n=1 Tax=Plakobranchus ocellatus TaxID=259542 RepID=A0AAV4BKG6_9GAST|nr:RNA-directed DNA polymerase from mobile element jockey [Plakobranchus ocellatus]
MLEEFTAENDLIILNSGEQTFVHSAYHSTSVIDLAVATPSIASECSWAAHSDLCGSDHFPIFLTLTSNFSPNVKTTSFNFQKADWSFFGDLCRLSLDDSMADIEQFTSKLLDAARSSIPFHKGTKCKTQVPRFTQEFRSKLDYGSVVYGSAKKHVLRALDLIHHQGLRIALGAFRTSPIKSLYAEAGESSLEHWRIKLASNYVLKLKSLPRNPCHEVVFEAPLSDFPANTKSEPNLVARTFERIKNAKIKLITIDNLHVQCPPPWEEHTFNVDIFLMKQKKKIPVKLLIEENFFRINEKFSNHYDVFTDGSKLEEKVAAAAYFPEHPDRSKATRLRDGASVFSAELEGIALTLTEIKKLTKTLSTVTACQPYRLSKAKISK